MPKWKRRQLKRNPRPKHERHALQVALAGVDIDREAGVIRNVPVITIGPAIGHGFEVDATTLQQVVTLIGSGVPVNLTHEDSDSLPNRLGMLVNCRVDGDSVRGDIQLSEAAKYSPHGDMWNFILALAADQPEEFGLSITFDDAGYEEIDRRKCIRVSKVYSADFVGTPAANPTGLLKQKGKNMDALLEVLRGMGLPEEITDPDQIAAWMKGRESANETEPEGDQPEDAPVEEEAAATPKPIAVAASAQTDAVKLAAKAERDRIAGLRKLAATHKLNETWVLNHAEKGTPVLLAQQMAEELAAWRQNGVAVKNITVGEDRNRATLAAGMTDAILLRAGIALQKPHDRAKEFRGRRMTDIARFCLENAGIQTVGFTQSQLFDECRRNRHQLAQSSSDFDNILRDAVNKTLGMAYMDEPRNWPNCFRRATNADFKTIYRTKISEAPTPTSRKEGAGITYGTLTDGQETYSLVEYVSGIKLTRQALINDDLDAFSRIPQSQGGSCARLEDNVAFAILTTNAALADGTALFDESTHKNRVTTGKAAISVTSLAKTAALLRRMKGTGSAAWLNIQPEVLLVPAALEVIAMQTVNSVVDPAKSNATVNPFNGRFRVVVEPRLDDTSTTAWYLLANPNRIDTVEVCFLEDEPAPVLRQEVDFDTEDVKFAVRHTVAAKAIDYRGMAVNDGA